jgi:serine/threonine protein kinase
MALDTALGMRFLHSQKVMHRDLKTENLLVHSPAASIPLPLGLWPLGPTSLRARECAGRVPIAG